MQVCCVVVKVILDECVGDRGSAATPSRPNPQPTKLQRTFRTYCGGCCLGICNVFAKLLVVSSEPSLKPYMYVNT